MSGRSSNGSDELSRLSVTSDTANIARVRVAVEDGARRVGFSDADVSSIALAIDEALANVIRHGYDGESGQPIVVAIEQVCRDGRAGLQVTIRDCGRQVNPDEIVGRDLADVRPGGLGTHIMKTVMDEIEYARCQPVGMQLRLLKMIAGASGNQQGHTFGEEVSPNDRQ